MDGLTAAEQREFQSRMERKQMKEFMGPDSTGGKELLSLKMMRSNFFSTSIGNA
ncbi:putative Mitochondrial import inner membrane translocase subunit tim9 [Glarea lozoyensis 74030]|uniref:Putative Mitochondrial import inner membrane translocase subunit tim9 n=1 Tax=Glarea lozoyensis (strain ATCC 74030 / MF5533) TaxID=1104152 RepID=H0ES49_GLAL7|nr:putative Mitochondrial import inner membrane translocase subunit tim9 [Glarea lozoyensis 74030]